MTAGTIDERLEETLADSERRANSTVQSPGAIATQLHTLARDGSIERIVDVGCGDGGLAAFLADELDAEAVGIDTDEELLARAAERGIHTHHHDIEQGPLPVDDGSVDLYIALGLLEHLRYYDVVFEEAERVVTDGGWLWLAAPNLGSWINRLVLALGYQPRDVEISTERAFGIAPFYPSDACYDHVRTPTYGALREMVEHYGFDLVSSVGLSPYQRSRLVAAVDFVLARRTPLARRLSLLAKG